MTQNDLQRHIKNARDILVGKVPDPKSQVDQITLALMYKFIDDMDQNAEEMDGQPTFFTGDYKKYSWRHLLDVKLGNQERMNLYDEALKKLPFNENLPPLFREIFKDAFLPYRDPNTLSLFLKEINYFSYDNSENLGSAFEHLLSVMSSQGDAGQFRTPRHIIDFIVAAVNPQKTDTILDPACGTAGFLISAFKHILKTNDNKLSPDERKRISDSFAGYDISPDMVRLSLVNLYLHGFKQPKIFEYDSLGSDSKWNEFYDVILANPPFMTPRGGIKPHARFEVRANRSEVLFVDYIMEHLTPNGRAGVIVPEGIIFQSANAYKALRKMLVENNYLYAVVSLPAGVFNPYAGVKTSVLLIDRVLARKTKGVLFAKIQNDGFDLGAQRRPIEKNDLFEALQIIKEYQKNPDKEINSDIAQVISKTKIAKSSDYNLSGDRYRVATDYTSAKWPMVELGEICNIESGSRQKGGAIDKGVYSIGGEQISKDNEIRFGKMKYISEDHFSEMKKGILSKGDVLMVKDGATTGKMGFWNYDSKAAVNEHVFIFRAKNQILPKYLFRILRSDSFQYELKPYIKGIIGGISLEIKRIKILLPSLEVQKQIVEIIDSYQKIIDGAKQVIANWKPEIKIDPDWKKVKFGDVCNFVRGPFGGSLKKEIFVKDGYSVYEQFHAINNDFSKFRYFITKKKFVEMKRFAVKPNDLIMSCSGTMGKTAIIPIKYNEGIINQALLKLTPSKDLDVHFLKLLMDSNDFRKQLTIQVSGVAIQNVASVKILQNLILPLPLLDDQKEIVEKIEAEQNLVEANKKLIKIMEEKIKKVIDEI